jgi:hypothetical protein
MWRPPSEDDTDMRFVDIGGQRHLVPSPPTALPRWLPLADGYVLVETPRASTAESGEIIVSRFSAAGDTVYRSVLGYAPESFTSASLDSIAARAARGAAGGMLAMSREGGGSINPVPNNVEVVENRLRAEMDFPEFQLPLESAWLAQDESVWLRRRAEPGQAAQWIILGPAGSVRGQVALPERARLLWSRGDSLIVAEPDELDVPWVVRYALRPE